MKIKSLLLLLIIVFSFNACKKSDEPTPITEEPATPTTPTTSYTADNSFKIVAYMPSYRDPETVDISKYKMITHLFYAFLEINAAGDGSLNALSQPTRFAKVVERAKANKVKIGISISGTSSYFVTMAASATARTKFVTNVVNFAKFNMLDGVDLDWEYPSTKPGIESADNYVLVVKELANELHKAGKFLSAAVTPAVYVGDIRNGIKQETYAYIDFFNIMQYDGQTWDTADPNQHASYKMSVFSLDTWFNTKALPKEKAVLGMPLYGKTAFGATTPSTKGYRDFETAGLDVNLDRGTYNGTEYWFNGINTIKLKTQLAKERANGIMFWEFSFDSNSSKSLIRAANDQLGRTY